MAQNTMYVSKNNSPQTTLTNEITATEQTIPVADVSKLPAAPNIVSIGSGDNIELVYYAGISGSTLTGCVRGYHGTTASIWYEDTPVYRAYTSYDHDTFKGNIEDLAANKLDKTGDGSSTTVTFTEAGALAKPATGESQATLWGKILKLFNQTSGHDHDGTNSKKIAYANVTDTPAFETSASNIKPDGTASAGSSGKIADAAHIHPEIRLLDNDGAHNSVYRGVSLGTSVSAAQYAAISAGTFKDMYIGDYWTIGDVVWRIAAFNYFYNCGDTAFTSNHITIVPDTSLASSKMNDTDTTDGGYYGSGIRASGSGLDTAKTIINSAFSDHVATHRQFLTNAVTNGKPSGGSWYDCSVELMSEIMVYGCGIFKPVSDGTTMVTDYTISKSQLPLFALNPKLIISSRYDWWLRDVVSGNRFAAVGYAGFASCTNPSNGIGVRPAFSIIG